MNKIVVYEFTVFESIGKERKRFAVQSFKQAFASAFFFYYRRKSKRVRERIQTNKSSISTSK